LLDLRVGSGCRATVSRKSGALYAIGLKFDFFKMAIGGKTAREVLRYPNT